MTIFDCEEKTLAAIAEKMVAEMVTKKEIRSGDQEGVLKALVPNRRYSLRHQPTVTQFQGPAVKCLVHAVTQSS